MSNESVELRINGRKYCGWKSFNLKRSIDSLCGAFSVEASDLFSGNPKDWNIKIGQSCSIYINNQLTLSGYIDDVHIKYEEDSHMINVIGRDNTADLVDCSHYPYGESTLNQVSEWKSKSICKIIQYLCDPFQIKVVLEDFNVAKIVSNNIKTDTENFSTFNIGEQSVGELISKICMTRAILPVCYGDGCLTLTRAGNGYSSDALADGVNILSAELIQSNKDRYSHYVVKGQGIGETTQELRDWITPNYVYEDHTIEYSRRRPKIFYLDTMANNEKCKKRAIWEARRRLAEGRKLRIVVQGFCQYDGFVWKINKLVRVYSIYLGFLGDSLLISDINFVLDDGGSKTILELVSKEAYELKETPLNVGFPYDLSAGD